MKKILFTILSVGILSSCYRDLGNYDYNLDSMNEITSVTFSPGIVETINGKTIEVQRALTEEERKCHITANVEQTLIENQELLDFNWFISHIDKEGKDKKDTLYTKGYLDLELPLNDDITYNVFLQIYDPSTKLSHYSSFKVMTRPLFKNSLFVLHGNSSNSKLGNIEVIGSETNIRTDITPITPGNVYDGATGFDYTTFYDLDINHLEKQNYAHTLTVFGNGTGTKAYYPFGMNLKFVSSQMFKPENENFVFKKAIKAGDPSNNTLYRIVLTENGDVYIGNTLHTLYKPGYSIEQGNNDQKHQSDYMITAATITHNRMVFWDAKNNRFLYCAKNSAGMAENEESSVNPNLMAENPLLDSHIDYSTLPKSPEGLTAILGYINYRENYSGQNAYFIFKDETNGTFHRYELSQLTSDDIGFEKSSANRESGTEKKKPAFGVEYKEMKDIKAGCNASTITYNSWFTSDYLFYADGKTVYRYNVSNGNNIALYEAPEGYDISMIKFRSEDSHSYAGDLGLYMSIGLYNGTNGAVAEIKLNTAGDLDKNFETLFYDKDNDGNRWGAIKDMQFAREYVYERTEF